MSKFKRHIALASFVIMLLTPVVAHAQSMYLRLNYGDGTVNSASTAAKCAKVGQATSVDGASCAVWARCQSRATSTGTWYTRSNIKIYAGSGSSNYATRAAAEFWRLQLSPSIITLGWAQGTLQTY